MTNESPEDHLAYITQLMVDRYAAAMDRDMAALLDFNEKLNWATYKRPSRLRRLRYRLADYRLRIRDAYRILRGTFDYEG